ncbi:MAG: hypothetical protein WCF03_03125 [Nitrososphaeraceae archaeon]
MKVGLKVPYRTVQGIVRGLSETKKCTHIRRRILKINPSVRNLGFEGGGEGEDNDRPITLIVDASLLHQKIYYLQL